MTSRSPVRLEKLLRTAHLTRFPEPAVPADYAAAYEEILDHLTALPGCLAVYRTGSVSVPGISDLDFILVVEDRAEVPPFWDRLSPRTRYLSMHSPAIADQVTFSRHRWFASAEPLDLTWGEALPVEPRPSEPLASLLIAGEGLVMNYLRLAKQGATRRVKVRPTLCSLNTLGYSLDLAETGRQTKSEAWGFADEVTALRNGWFEGGGEQIREVLARSVEAMRLAMADLANRAKVEALTASDGENLPSMRLGSPWDNVVLDITSDAQAPQLRGQRWLHPVSMRGRSQRAAELHWRVGRWRLSIADALMRLLSGRVAPQYREFLAERDALVRSYQMFVVSKASSYGMLGTAGSFLDRGNRGSNRTDL